MPAPIVNGETVASATAKINAAFTDLDGKQPLDSDLTAIAALTTTAYGRSLLALADAAAARAIITLGNVDNTSDLNKPISTAIQTALDARALLAPAPATITYAASVALDITAINRTLRTISLTGDLTLTTTNRVAGGRTDLRLICDATIRTLTFPAGWIFTGAARPADIAASKTGHLILEWFGTADTDCLARWRVEP